jgi:hypothetical protein
LKTELVESSALRDERNFSEDQIKDSNLFESTKVECDTFITSEMQSKSEDVLRSTDLIRVPEKKFTNFLEINVNHLVYI